MGNFALIKCQSLHKAIPVCIFLFVETEGSTRSQSKRSKTRERYEPLEQRKKMARLTVAIKFSRSKSTSLDYLFIKYNTSLPNSAEVERLFSLGSGILTAKRASLTSTYFQRLVSLKEILDFSKWQGIMETSAHGSVDMATSKK